MNSENLFDKASEAVVNEILKSIKNHYTYSVESETELRIEVEQSVARFGEALLNKPTAFMNRDDVLLTVAAYFFVLEELKMASELYNGRLVNYLNRKETAESLGDKGIQRPKKSYELIRLEKIVTLFRSKLAESFLSFPEFMVACTDSSGDEENKNEERH